MLQKPSDLGYEDNGFILPPLNIQQITVKAEEPTTGSLFAVEAQTLQERQQARRESLTKRVTECADIVNQSNEPWIIWCNLNGESEALTKAINGAVEIRGSHSPEYKEKAMMDFVNGKIKKVVSKPSIMGFGMNYQHCSKMAFVGLSDSFEEYFQAVRLLAVIRHSGLEDDAFTCWAALYRWSAGRPGCEKIHAGLENYFHDVVVDGDFD